MSRDWVCSHLWAVRHNCADVFYDLFSGRVSDASISSSDVAEEEYRLICEVYANAESAHQVYADWLEEHGMMVAAQSHRLAVLGYKWVNINGIHLSLLAPRPHRSLVTQTLGMCLSSAQKRTTSNVMWWALAPSSVDPEEHWTLEQEDFAELTQQLAERKKIHAEYRGMLPFNEAILNILGIAQFWEATQTDDSYD